MRTAIVLLLLAPGLVGCLGKEAVPAGSGAPPTTGDLEPSVIVDPAELAPSAGPGAAPVWKIGDAWSITTYGDDAPGSSFLVVTAVDVETYTMATTSPTLARWDAMFDVSYVGPIKVADLSGRQQETTIRFFDFPLADGKTWTTTWDGLEVSLAAKQSARGFEITGTVEGEPYVVYDYVPDLRWWSKVDFVRDGYGFTVDRAVERWSGTLVSATAKVLLDVDSAAMAGGPGTGAFTMDAGQTYGIVSVWNAGERWMRGFALVQPDGQPFRTATVPTFDSQLLGSEGSFQYEIIPAMPGQWHVVSPSLHDPTGWSSISAHQVLLVERAFP